MPYNTDTDIMRRVKEHLKSALAAHPCDWFVICVQGSFNYGMVDAESDIDTKLLTIPSIEDLVFNRKPMNTVHVMENDEHVDMKDVREYFKIFRKSNINFVEILFTDYYIVNEKYQDLWLDLKAHAEELARLNPYAAVSCMKGMALEKKHALCHEYPSRMPWIEKYGYDPKQLSHIARIAYFIKAYLYGYPYKDCIYPRDEEYRNALLQCKRNGQGRTKEEAIDYANLLVDHIALLADAARGNGSYMSFTDDNGPIYENKIDPDCDMLLDNVLYKIITRSLNIKED